MSTTDRRRVGSVWALMCGSPCWSAQSAPARSRSSNSRATRSSSRSATSSFVSSGRSSRDPSAPRIETRLVSVPNPEPASATSLATSKSAPLRRSFSGARSSEPVSAANPTRTGRVELPAPRRAWRPARMSSDLGQEVRWSVPARRQPVRESLVGRRWPAGSRRRRRPSRARRRSPGTPPRGPRRRIAAVDSAETSARSPAGSGRRGARRSA